MRRPSRRQILRRAAAGAAGLGAAALTPKLLAAQEAGHDMSGGHGGNLAVGDVDLKAFDPSAYLTEFDYGAATTLPDGRTLRTWQIVAADQEIEVAPGVYFPAWTYNGQVPGPTLRCKQGDRLRIEFTNGSSHPHTIHFHGIHAANMDGVFEQVQPGGRFVYEFDGEPFGVHLYHCHSMPLKRHIHKGLYGVFIVDPPEPRPAARELVMMTNAFDTNLDGDNEVYAVNTVAFHYLKHPIRIKRNELVRVYLVNITEFDAINGIHIHANFFDVYRTGTRLQPDELTDTITLGQAQRAILEFRYPHAGNFMFHAHVSEFTELGWNGVFEVVE